MSLDMYGRMDNRRKELYVAEEYKIFLLTGQKYKDLPEGQDALARAPDKQAYITVHPFNSLSEEEVALLKTEAKPLEGVRTIKLECHPETKRISVYDTGTRSTSWYSMEILDEDVKARLLPAPQAAPEEEAAPPEKKLIAAENFPLYQLMQKNGGASAERMAGYFALARDGDDHDRYAFAQGLQTMVQMSRVAHIAGQTAEINSETLKGCLAVFEDQAGRHAKSAFMAAYNRLHGLGCAKDKAAARRWIEKCEMLGGRSVASMALRRQAAEVPPAKGNGESFRPGF